MPQVSAVLEQANQATNKAKQNLLPANVNPKQSPIDLLPAITAFDPSLENATFKLNYDNSVKLTVENLGQYGGLSLRWPNNLNNTAEINGVEQQKEGNSSFECSFLEGQQFQLEQILFHWGTEPMNGSLHTIAGVGYAGEIHIIHRNTKFPNMTEALKHPEEQGTLFIEKLRELRKSRQEDEVEQPLLNNRPLQPANSRLIRSSFKSAAQAELPK
uniref:Alpha-carbonic anhydrase domain-containing protein n=1 Tax=Meloidogyne javanica TaxID=6303 RepID=A0A915N5L6_MELJA